jgi:hypothetical protein
MLGFHQWHDIFVKKNGFRNDIQVAGQSPADEDIRRLNPGIVKEGGICSLDGS